MSKAPQAPPTKLPPMEPVAGPSNPPTDAASERPTNRIPLKNVAPVKKNKKNEPRESPRLKAKEQKAAAGKNVLKATHAFKRKLNEAPSGTGKKPRVQSWSKNRTWINGDPYWEISAIEGVRESDSGSLELRVRWKDYKGPDEVTWEPEKNLTRADKKVYEFFKALPEDKREEFLAMSKIPEFKKFEFASGKKAKKPDVYVQQDSAKTPEPPKPSTSKVTPAPASPMNSDDEEEGEQPQEKERAGSIATRRITEKIAKKAHGIKKKLKEKATKKALKRGAKGKPGQNAARRATAVAGKKRGKK